MENEHQYPNKTLHTTAGSSQIPSELGGLTSHTLPTSKSLVNSSNNIKWTVARKGGGHSSAID